MKMKILSSDCAHTLGMGMVVSMNLVRQRLVTAVVIAFVLALCACGQRSILTLPSDEEAKNRASLPQILLPGPLTKPSSAKPQAPQSPVSTDNNPSNNPSNNTSNSTSTLNTSPQ